jgi:hypothetical protein
MPDLIMTIVNLATITTVSNIYDQIRLPAPCQASRRQSVVWQAPPTQSHAATATVAVSADGRTVISAALITGINSDLPGQILATAPSPSMTRGWAGIC